MANQIKYQVGFDVNTQNLNQLKSSLQDLQKLKISDIMKIKNTDYNTADKYLINIKEQAKNVEEALRKAFNTKLGTINVQQFNSALKDSGSSINQVYDRFNKAGASGQAAFRDLTSSVLTTNIQLKETHTLLDKMAKTLANTIKWNVASSIVNGFSRSVEQAWGYVKALDTSLNDIRIVTGKSSDEMAKFAVQANNAAKELGKTTTDYTNAALIYAQQGLSDEQIQERAAITLKAANVTGQSTDAVSEQLTAVWNGYKVTADEAQLYVDRLAAVAATTASNLQELSTGMSKVASAAAAMGVGQDQLAAQLSTIISVTRQAPESVGTALRTVYARISDIKAGIDEDGVTLGNYSGKMAELGFNVLDMNGNLRDMGEVMEEIGNRWESLTREQQISLAQTMAGQRQYSNLIALFDNFEKYNESLAVAQGAAGTLQEQQDIYMDQTAAHLQTLKASMEDIYDSLADTDSINSIIDALSQLATFGVNFVDSLGGGIPILQSLGAIGLTVFSQQIAKGINTTITNLEIGKNNARQFDQALQATRDWQGIPALDKTHQDLLKNREQLLELARLMTPEQFSGMQTLLNNITKLGNEIQKMQTKMQPLKDTLKNFTDTPLEKVIGNKQEIDKIEGSINNTVKGLDELKQNTEKAKEEFEGLITSTKKLFKETKIDDFNGTFKIAKDRVTDLLNSFHDLKNTEAFKGLSEQAKSEFDKIDTYWDNLLKILENPNISNDVKSSALESFFNKISQAAEKSSGVVQTKYQELIGIMEDPSFVQSLEQKKQQLEKMINDFVTGQERMQKAANIESYAKMAGGIAQVGSAIQQIQNLGSIWKNEDLTTGEKLLQTITNLAISLPMLITGFEKATTALGLMKVMETEEAVIAGYSTSAEAAHAVSIGLVDSAAGAATIKVQLLNTTIMLNPFVVAAAAALALAAALGAVAKAAEEARKASLENSQAIIQEQNSIQEQLNSHKNLYDTLEEANQKYKDGEISRSELKGTIEDLISQYNLEDDAVNKLRNSYNNLSEAIEELRIKDAKYKKESSKKQLKDAENAIIQTAKGGGNNWQGIQNINNQKYTLRFSGGNTLNDEPEQVKQELQNLGFSNYGGGTFSQEFDKADPAVIADMYDQISESVSRLNDTLDAETRNASDYYLAMVQWLKDMKESVEEYREVQEQVAKYSVELDALTKEQNGQLSFGSVNNAVDYITQRNELIKQIEKIADVDTEKATKMADVYLQENFENLHRQFDEAARYVDSLQEKFDSIDNDVVEKLGKLSPQQLAFIEDIGLRDIQNWKDLASILEYMEKVDLSNLKVVTDPQGAFEDASNQYNLYSSLSDQISNNKNQTISKKEYEKLTPEVQEFFSLMANGQYKMTGDAKEFYDTVNNLSIEGFKKNIADLQGSSQRLKNLQNADFDKMFSSAATDKGDGTFSFVSGDVNQQLDFLTEMGYSLEKIVQWKAELADGHVTVGMLNDIAQACGDFANQTDKLSTYLKANEDAIYQNQLAIGRSATSFDTLKGYLDDGTISQKAFTQAAIELDASLDLQGLDTKQLEKYADHLQQISTSSQALSDELKDNEQAAQIVAKGIMKMNDAVKKLSDNWDDWSDALKKNSKQSEAYANAMGETKETVADLLDISKDYVSDDFIQDHLDDISNAANGSQEAIDSLKNDLAEDIIVNIMVQNGLDKDEQANILSTIASLQAMIPDIEVGATIDDGEFLAKANQLIQDCGMTVDQANAVFDALGFEANFETKTEMVHQRVPRYITQTEVIEQSQTSDGKPITTTATSTWQNGFDEFDGEMDVPAMATNKKTPVINSLTKKAGGGFSSGSSGGKSGSGGKGGGGGGSQNKPDTSKKEKKKLLKKTADPYHDVNRDLKKIDRSLQKLAKDQDKLFGKQYIDNLNKQNATLDKSIAKLKEKQKIQKQDLKNQRQTLKNLGFTFDKYGNITNYQQLLTAKQSEVNGLIAERNKLVQEYNKSTDKAFKQRQGAIIKQLDDRIKQGQDTIKQIEDAAKQYEDTQTAFGENNDAIDEAERKKIENNIKKFRYSIELRLDLGEATRDWNEFVRNVLQPTDVLRDNDFDELFADARQDFNDLRSYFGDGGFGGSIGTIEALTNQLKNDLSEINQINKTGWSDIYGKDKAQAMEHLKQDWEDLMQQMENVQQLIKNIDNAYLKMPDYMAEQFDKQIEAYDFINGLIQHDIDLLQILYGEESYAAMDKYYNKMMDNQNKQIDSLRKQADFWKQQRDAAIAAGQTNMAEKFEENYKRAIQNINSAIEDAANLLKDKYTNTINLIFDELNNKLTNGKGLDYLGQQWEYMQDAADEYLDTINAAYNLQTLQNKFQKAINNTEGLKNQKALKKLMDEQLENLKAREKLTQYDVDRAEKLLQVEQARIALEQAQSSKTSLRLKRDAQGNYSYQYVADEQGVEDAQQNYLDANNELTNFDMDRNRQNQNDMLAAWREYWEKRSQIEIKYRGDDVKRIQQLALLEQAYQDKITGLLEQNLNIRNNLMDSAIQNYALLYGVNVDNYRKMSDDQRDILMNELVPEWDSSIQTMMNKIVEQGGFIPATQDAFEELHKATYDYEKELEQMAETAGISLDDVAQGTDNLTEEFSELVEENDQLINRMGTELDAIRDLKAEADALKQQYKEVTDAAEDMVTQIQQVIQNEYDQAASYQATGRAYEAMTSTIYNAAVNLQNNLNALFGGQQFGGDSGNNGNGTNGTGVGPGTKDKKDTKIEKPGQPDQQDYPYDYRHQMYFNYKKLTQYATGGYTGNWDSNEGRIAVLHEKQLVLNQDDTKNFLNGISILRQIAGNFKGNLQAKMANVKSNFGLFNSSSNDTIEQNVKIEASFPNVNSRQQIEEAFNNLVNLAAQRAMRR